MIDGLPLAGFSELSGWALAALLFVLMAVGRIVSVRTLEREAKFYQRYIDRVEKEAEQWRTAHGTLSAQLSSILDQYQHVRPPTPIEPAA